MALNAFTDKLSNITGGLVSPTNRLPLDDGEDTRLKVTDVKYLPWFGSPIAKEEEHGHGHHGHGHGHGDDHGSISSTLPDGEPNLVKHHEAPVIQLFYDLFFVANLCTFTSVHEVNDSTTLKSYIGFFSVIWFTWLQVTLFHLRLGVDSVFERVAKGLQFGVMTGFAVVGPAYKLGWEEGDKEAQQALNTYKVLALILMGSRLTLAIQYAWAMIHLRKYKRSTVPLLIHAVIFLTTASVFLGMYFWIQTNSTDKSVIGFYVTFGVEMGLVCLLAGKRRFMSFRRTNIVERIGLITLIIVGEGVIGLCGSVQKVGNDQKWGADMVGLVICGVLIVYSIFMLYFDQTEHEKIGTMRQQFWVMAHFPMHVTILMTVEGSAQLVTWRKLIDTWYQLKYDMGTVLQNANTTTINAEGLKDLASHLNETFHGFYEHLEEGVNEMKHHPNFNFLHKNMQAIADLGNNSTDGLNITEITTRYAQESFASAAVLAAKNMGVEPPHHVSHEGDTDDMLDALLEKTFSTVFVYFFIAAGLCIIMTAVMFILGRRHKLKTDYYNIGFRCILGTGLALLSTMIAGGGNSPAFSNYAESPWMLPTVAITFVVAVVADNIFRILTHRTVVKMQAEHETASTVHYRS